MEICIYSNDIDLINNIESFLDIFFYDKNTKYKITKINSYSKIDYFEDFDVLFIDTNNDFFIDNNKDIYKIYLCDILYFISNNIHNKNIIFKPLKYKSFFDEFSLFFDENKKTHKKNTSFILDKIKSFNFKNKQKKFPIYKEYNSFKENQTNYFLDKNYKINILDYYSNETLISESSSILFICSDNNFNSIIYKSNSFFNVDYSLDYFEKQFANIFFRCNDNFIVNLRKISKIGKDFVIINNIKIDVDKDKFNKLKENLSHILKINVNK